MILAVLGLAVSASSCRDADPDAITDPDVQPPDSAVVASIEMLPVERQLSFIGMSDRMGARRVAADGSFLGGSTVNEHLFSWSSDRPDVVSVNGLGVVTGLREGTARITATSAGVTGTATVTVREVVRLAWTLPIDRSPGAITIGDDGTIYVPAYGTLHALDMGRQHRWSVPTSSTAYATPAIAPNGTLYVGMFDSFAAIERSGTVRWSRPDLDRAGAPVIGSDGTVYLARGRDSTVYALDPDGRTKWRFKAGATFTAHLSLARDGTILVGGDDGRLFAVNPDGTERWSFQTVGPIGSTPAVGFDGTIYFGSPDQREYSALVQGGRLYALTPEGALAWSLPLTLARGYSDPAIGPDGTIYIGGDGLHAVDPSGRLRWSYLGTNPRSGTEGFDSPIVAGDGTIYVVGGRSGGVFALGADGTPKWDYPTERRVFGVPAIGLDGSIFVASSDSTLQSGIFYAITELEGSNGGFASAPWPKERGDRANTGRARGP
jgi:outer membrane protein assembly factor BamB